MRVEFVDAARDDASAAASHYESEVPGLGFEFLAEIDRGTAVIGEHPNTWPTIGSVRGQAMRRFLLSRFPHGLVYVVVADHVLVVAVAHGRRRPGYWAKRVPRR